MSGHKDPAFEHYGVTTALTDGKQPFLIMKTRWQYLNALIPRWKNAIRYRLYTFSLLVAGLWLLFTTPLVAVVCLFMAMYFEGLRAYEESRLTVARKIIIGQ